MATLTEDEKARVRYHLGYPNVEGQAALFYGIPASRPTAFLVDLAVQKLIPAAVETARSLLASLDRLGDRMDEISENLDVESLDGIKINLNAGEHIRREYRDRAYRLADLLGVPVYHLSPRFSGVGGGVGNITVVH